MFITRQLLIATAISLPATYLSVYRWELIHADINDLAGLLATFGITLFGFFITAASILSGFSSMPYMQKVIKNENVYKNLINLFMATIAVSFAMASTGLLVKLLNSGLTNSAQAQQFILALFVFELVTAIYFTVYSIRILRIVLVSISGRQKKRA